jgi:4-hydroxybenzoyl-CoA thioesterase
MTESAANEAATRVNRRQVRIEWGDCDPANIVYFPRYFEIFDASTNAAFEAVGLPKPLMLSRFGIVGIPAVDVRAKFSIPSSFGEDVVILTRIARWGRSSFDVYHQLKKGDQTAVEGFETRVWTGRDAADPGRLRAQPVPQQVIDLFNVTDKPL